MARSSRVQLNPFEGYIPTPTQGQFFEWEPPKPTQPDLRLLSSGYASGGKSTTGCRESIRYTLGFPHSRHVISRYHYDDLADTTMVTYFEALDRIGLSDGTKAGPRHYIFRKSPRPEIDWWHGAKTLFRNLDDPSGSKYGSMEVSTWFIDEAFEVPSDVLRVIYPSRLRWHLPTCPWKNQLAAVIASGGDPAELTCPCPRRMWACTNPGPNDFLRGVIDGSLGNSAHFAVPFGENIYMGPGYFEAMAEEGKAYGDVWFRRWVLGSWDAFEGQRFTMLDKSTHILPHDLMPSQDDYDIIEGHDFGWRNPHAVLWLAVHKAREYPPIFFDWYEVAEREIPDHAAAIRARRDAYHFRHDEILAVGDPAGMQTRGQTGISDIMLFAEHGLEIIPMRQAKMPDARADLLALMFSRVVKTRDGEMRGLMFTPRTEPAYQKFVNVRYKEKPRSSHEDAPERFVKKDDHTPDAGGYAVSAVSDPLEREGPGDEHRDWLAFVSAHRRPTPAELDRMELTRR